MEVEIRGPGGALLPDRSIGKLLSAAPASWHGYFRDEESTARLPQRRRLARHRRHGLFVGRLHLHRRPRQGHDHHQRPQPLAAGHRMGGRAAARLQVRRHRRLRHHRPVRRGNPRGARPLPRSATPTSAAACATTSASASARSPASPRWSSSSPRAPCPAPARASCRGPRRATSICPAKSSPTISRPELAALHERAPARCATSRSDRGRRSIAQLVEHRSPKPRVVGSSPSTPARARASARRLEDSRACGGCAK